MRQRHTQRREFMRDERGSVLGIVLIMGVLMGIFGYIMLILGGHQVQQSQGMQSRARSQYIAEAGYVLVSQKLINPAWRNYPDTVSCQIIPGQSHCTFGSNPGAVDPNKACDPLTTGPNNGKALDGTDAQAVEYIDVDGDGVDTSDPWVVVTVKNCGADASVTPPKPRPHQVLVKASY